MDYVQSPEIKLQNIGASRLLMVYMHLFPTLASAAQNIVIRLLAK